MARIQMVTVIDITGESYEFQHAYYEKTKDGEILQVRSNEGLAEFNWNNIVCVSKEEIEEDDA